jgi:hypothetical protein
MKKLIFLLSIVILAGCSPTKRLARLLERHPVPEKIDTVFTPGETVYKDTTVYKYLPGETAVESLYIDVPVSIPDTVLVAHTSAAGAIAWLQNNQLGLRLIQYDKVFEFMLDSAIRENTPDTIRITNEKIVTVEKMVNKPFYRSGFFILAGLIIIALLFYFLLRR